MNSALSILVLCIAVTYGAITTVAPVPETTTPSKEPPKTTTTTLAPTTTAKPTTTEAPPAPKPNATVVSFNVSCILIELEADFSVPYTRTDNKSDTGHIVIPKSAVAQGSCHPNENAKSSKGTNEEQSISITWAADDNATRTLNITFSSDGKKYSVSSIGLAFVLDSATFPGDANIGSEVTVLNSKPDIEPTELAYSYQCNSKQTVTLASLDNKTNVTLHLADAKLQAFSKVGSFGEPELCEADASGTSDIVPIAVGCALAGLVLIVIVAYLIGRRRAKSKGYQSM